MKKKIRFWILRWLGLHLADHVIRLESGDTLVFTGAFISDAACESAKAKIREQMNLPKDINLLLIAGLEIKVVRPPAPKFISRF